MRIIFTLGISLIINIAYSQTENSQAIVIRTMSTLRPVKEIQLNIVIKDINDKAPVSGATVSIFRPFKKDSLHFAANDSGIVVSKFPGTEDSYTVRVTAVGYGDTSIILLKNAKHDVLLKRKPLELKPVVVFQGVPIRCGGYFRICRGVKIREEKVKSVIQVQKELASSATLKMYPNPLVKGGMVNIEFNSTVDQNVMLRIFSISGKMISSTNITASKGLNRFHVQSDTRWPAGTYIFQLSYAKGGVAASGKVIIQ